MKPDSSNTWCFVTLYTSSVPAHTTESKFTSGHLRETFVFAVLQRATLGITWPTTRELRCSWPWGSPNPPCRTSPEPSSSNPTSWLWVREESPEEKVYTVSLFSSLNPDRPSPRLLLPPQARLQRGNILLKQGNTQEAREDFEAVVSLRTIPNFANQNRSFLLRPCSRPLCPFVIEMYC